MTSSTESSPKFSDFKALKLLFIILTFSGEVWLPNNTRPFLFKWEHMCAGPVSFDIINFAL